MTKYRTINGHDALPKSSGIKRPLNINYQALKCIRNSQEVYLARIGEELDYYRSIAFQKSKVYSRKRKE